MSAPTKILSREHEFIVMVLDALVKECDAIQAGKGINRVFFEKAIGFIRNYADGIHHAKEEKILFPELDKDCVSMHCNPVPQMLFEHEEGRKFVKGMADALKNGDEKKLVLNARGYVNLLKEHIFKEDNILFSMAEDALPAAAKQQVTRQFEAVDAKSASEKRDYEAFAKDCGAGK